MIGGNVGLSKNSVMEIVTRDHGAGVTSFSRAASLQALW
jgi:hypothetical protein